MYRAYDQYSFQLIPVMGQIIARDWDSYLYLVQSIRKFPTQVLIFFMIKYTRLFIDYHLSLVSYSEMFYFRFSGRIYIDDS